MFMIRRSTGSCGVGVLTLEARDAYPVLHVYSGSVSSYSATLKYLLEVLYIYLLREELVNIPKVYLKS